MAALLAGGNFRNRFSTLHPVKGLPIIIAHIQPARPRPSSRMAFTSSGNHRVCAPAPLCRRLCCKSSHKLDPAPSTGVGSDDGTSGIQPVLGGSKMPWLRSFVKYFISTAGTGAAAWYLHPHLLDLAADVLNLNFEDSVTAFQTNFFNFLSILFAIFSGNTMAFLYERQKEVVRQFYMEVSALEQVLEESVYALGPGAHPILEQVRKYIDQEIRAPNNQLPPLQEGLALVSIRNEARRHRNNGIDMSGVLAAASQLSQAQTQRQANTTELLPAAHWALLYIIAITFVLTFLLFESGGSFSIEGRHALWTALCSLMVFVLEVLNDLADPSEGVYSATAAMEVRLGYTHRMLERHYQPEAKREEHNGHPDLSGNKSANTYKGR